MWDSDWNGFLHLRVCFHICVRDRRVKFLECKEIERVDICNYFFSFLMTFWLYSCNFSTYVVKEKKGLEITGGSGFLPSWSDRVEWTAHLITCWGCSIEIPRVHCWARSELLFLTFDPGDPQVSVGPGSGKAAGKPRQGESWKREAGVSLLKSDIFKSRPVRGTLCAAF